MERRHVRNWIIVATAAVLLAGAAAVLAGLDSGRARAQAPTQTVSATVGSSPTGSPLPSGFVGVSLEYGALRAYTGRDPRAVNPVLIELLRNLDPGGQTPILRIGGDSADSSWWPIRGVIPPAGISYTLTEGWLRTTRALASALGARLIMGVNLAGDSPALAATEARALLAGIGREYIEAFEIGNEPDVYNQFPWYRNRRGRWVFSRPHSYSISDYVQQFSQWQAALPSVPVAGPAFAELGWLSSLPRFIEAEHDLQVVTLHRYPLRACIANRKRPGYPTIAALLADTSSAGVAEAVAPYVGDAHSRGLAFRVDEMNSASCSGKPGVSNTFASALWVLDTLFNLANVGVDGVNVHSLPGAAYELFSFRHNGRGWEAFVHPEYYGMLLFTQAFPPGAQLLPVTVSASGPLKVWATHAVDGTTRVVLINKSQSTDYQVEVQIEGATTAAQLERLQAPSVRSTDNVTLGGQTFGDETRTGDLGGPLRSETLTPAGGAYTVTVPAASAALLTL